jgi:hypothetical protein
VKCFSGELPDCRVPVTDLPVDQMVHEGPGVLGEAGYKHADLQVGVRALPDSEIVRFCENVDSVRKRALEIRGNFIIEQSFGIGTGFNADLDLAFCLKTDSVLSFFIILRVEVYNFYLFFSYF